VNNKIPPAWEKRGDFVLIISAYVICDTYVFLEIVSQFGHCRDRACPVFTTQHRAVSNPGLFSLPLLQHRDEKFIDSETGNAHNM
jgi:hypothetical protein